MAANLHLRAAVPDHGQPGSRVVAGPPPSTLAAQLVENISASTKSSKSDENSELKGFFAIIQRVKDDPTLLKTPEDRVEHNHMLIYVYSRAVLEGIRLDDPFLDRTQVRTEGLKAISFLRFSICFSYKSISTQWLVLIIIQLSCLSLIFRPLPFPVVCLFYLLVQSVQFSKLFIELTC